MKILMITPYVPFPPSSGGQIRTLNLLKYLSQKNEITLVCLYKFETEKKYFNQLKPYCKKIFFCRRPENPWTFKTIFGSVFSLNPFLVVRNFSLEAKEVLEELFHRENFDVIHVETFYVMPFLPKTKIPILLVEQTIEYKVYQHFVKSLPQYFQPLFFIDILKLKFWERYYWRKASQVATVSDSDKKLINRLEPQIKPVIIPNCAGDEMVAKKLPEKNLNFPNLLFQGNFLWLQNTEAANILIKKTLPLLKLSLKKFKLIIAGQSASKKLKNFKDDRLEIIDIPQSRSDLVLDLYQKATLFLAPIFGPGGTRLKILAAMANGLPVISTKTGISGLDVQDEETVLIAETPQQFVEKTMRILSNKKLYQKIQTNAYLLIKEKYNWKKISSNLEIVYKKLIKHENWN